MTNPDREELVKLADELIAQNYGNVRDTDTMEEHFALLAKAASALRRLASSDGGVKVLEALETAIRHIEHMAAFIEKTHSDCGTYSFESLGEDMPGMKAALSASAIPIGYHLVWPDGERQYKKHRPKVLPWPGCRIEALHILRSAHGDYNE